VALERTPEVDDKLRELQELEQQIRKREERKENTALMQAQTRFDKFCEYVIRDESTDDPIVLAAIHKSWVEHVIFCWAHGLHAAIMAPFGHGKTVIFSVAFPLWLFGVDPTLRIKLFSANDDTAKERVELVRQYIDGSDAYKEVFPQVRASNTQEWSKHKIYIARPTKAKDASMQALGALSSGIGGRSDINIFDDINDAKNTLHQPRLREQVLRNYRGVFMSRLDRQTGLAMMICTRWHDRDTIGTIMKDADMRSRYGILIQRISNPIGHIDCEYIMGTPKCRKKDPKTALGRLLRSYEQGLFHDAGFTHPAM
jgi:hypothetical protein